MAADGRRHTHSLADSAAGAHESARRVGQVGGADQPSGQQQIVDVARIAGAVRDAVHRRDTVPDDVGALAQGHMVVKIVAAVGDVVGEAPALLKICLGENIVAQETTALPFSRLRTDPKQVPVLGLFSVWAILDMVPLAPELLEQDLIDLTIIYDRVQVAAALGDV